MQLHQKYKGKGFPPSVEAKPLLAGVRGKQECDEQRQLLQRIIEPFVLRRLKTDPNIAADLPDKVERTIECDLAPGQQALYKAVQEAELAGLDNGRGQGNAPGAFARHGRVLPSRRPVLTTTTDGLAMEVCDGESQHFGSTLFQRGEYAMHELQRVHERHPDNYHHFQLLSSLRVRQSLWEPDGCSLTCTHAT